MNTRIIHDYEEMIALFQDNLQFPYNWNGIKGIITYDFDHFSAKLLHVSQNTEEIAFALIFSIDPNEFYFGHIYADNESVLDLLINEIESIAKNEGFNTIIGPVNIPTIMYGWGFMKENSESSLSLAKPVNPSWYQDRFFAHGFSLKVQYNTWEGNFVNANISPPKPRNLDVESIDIREFEMFYPKDWKEIKSLKKEYFMLTGSNLSPESVVTPDIVSLFDNYLQFVIEYGDPFMFSFLKHKNTNELVGLINALPNPLKQKGEKSLVIFALVLNSKYRGTGLGMYMLHDLLTRAIERGYSHLTAPIEQHQEESQGLAKKLGLKHSRSHLVLKKTL